jgi:hypothetical protein
MEVPTLDSDPSPPALTQSMLAAMHPGESVEIHGMLTFATNLYSMGKRVNAKFSQQKTPTGILIRRVE